MAIAVRSSRTDARGRTVYDRPLTWHDLQQFPDDGLRYELVDGVLLVSPSPDFAHQRVVSNLIGLLREGVRPGFEVLTAPFDWYVSETTVFEPDVLVVRTDDLSERWLGVPPVLAVEVLSPSTRLRDLSLKRRYYGDCGLAWYWVVDPDPGEPRLTVLRLEGDRYVEDAAVTGDDEHVVEEPVAVTVVPRELVEPYPPPG